MLFLLFCSSVFCSSGFVTSPDFARGDCMPEPAERGKFSLLTILPAWVVDIISSEQKLLEFKPNFSGVSPEERREIGRLATAATSSLLGEYLRRCTLSQPPSQVLEQ